MMHKNNKQSNLSNIDAQTTKRKLSHLEKLSQLNNNQPTTNLSHNKLPQ